MGGLFDPENKFWNFVSKLGNVVSLSVLWAVTSLPLVTVGAATAALYDFYFRLVEDKEDMVTHGYFTAWKRRWKTATAVWGVQAAALALAALETVGAWRYFAAAGGGVWAVAVLGAAGCLLLLVGLPSLYLYPVLVAFGGGAKETVRRSFLLAFAHLPATLALAVLWGAAACAVYFWPALYFLWFALAAFCAAYVLREVFRPYLPAQTDEK